MNAKVVVKIQQGSSGEAIRVEPQTPSRHCCLWCFVVIAILWALCLEPLPAADKFRSIRDTDIKNVADLETMTADVLRNVVITRTGTRLSAKEIAVAKAVYSARLNTPVEFDPSAKVFFLSRRFQSRTAAMIVVSNIGEPNAVTFFGLPGTPYSYIEESPENTFRVVLKPDFKGIYPGEGEREGIARAMANPDDLVPVARAATASVIEPEHVLTNSAVMQDADDPTREKLERAKKEFETKTAKARRDLIADIDRQMLAAQKKGQKATYDQLSEEKQAFEKDGVLPKLISTKAYRKGVTPGQKALAAAFDEAVREYTKRRLLEEASRVQDEFKEFQAQMIVPVNDALQAASVWQGNLIRRSGNSVGHQAVRLTVTERKGRSFVGRLERNDGRWVRIVKGTIADGSLHWRAADENPIKGPGGGGDVSGRFDADQITIGWEGVEANGTAFICSAVLNRQK